MRVDGLNVVTDYLNSTSKEWSVPQVKAKGTYLNIHTQVGGIFLTKNQKLKTQNGF
jgi:hypothetical protein